MTAGFGFMLAFFVATGFLLIKQGSDAARVMGSVFIILVPLALFEMLYEAGRAVDMRALRQAAAAYHVGLKARRRTVELHRVVHNGILNISVDAPFRLGLQGTPRYTLTLTDANLTFLPIRLTLLSSPFAGSVLPHASLRVQGLEKFALESIEGSVSQLVTPELLGLLNALPEGGLELLSTQRHELRIQGQTRHLPETLGTLLELSSHIRKEFCEQIGDGT